ncbi:MAG: hypothetical protein ABJF11_06760 [Reichenbachiella sp.]|uniref:hypothetical protein n=1 Tax=Reichenbachiella sp. TaxID=2184521 RepID=UPI0032674817
MNKFTSKDDVAVFEYRIKNDSLMGFGITKNTVKDTFQLHINVVSPNETILSNQYLQYNLEMLNEQYDLPTGSNVELWAQQAIPKFATRMAERGCLDIRTEEEKMLPDLGEIEDDFDPIYISEDSLSFD